MRGSMVKWGLVVLIVAARMATVGSSPCADAVANMQRNSAFVSAFKSYFMNASVAVSSDGYSFTPTESREAEYQSACSAIGGYYCKWGGSISVSWMSSASNSPKTLSGAVSLCFPKTCCTGTVDGECDGGDGISDWVTHEVVVTLSYLCNTSSIFCLDPTTPQVTAALEQSCSMTEEWITIVVCVTLPVISFIFVALLVYRIGKHCLLSRRVAQRLLLASDSIDSQPLLRSVQVYGSLSSENSSSSCSTSDSRQSGDSECAICLESWKDTDEVSPFEPCGHLFHSDCIGVWMRRKPTCPVCRAKWESLSGSAV